MHTDQASEPLLLCSIGLEEADQRPSLNLCLSVSICVHLWFKIAQLQFESFLGFTNH